MNESQKLSGKGRIITIDSEAIGLTRVLRYNDPTCMHEIVVKDYETHKVYTFFDKYEDRDVETRIALEEEGMQDGTLEEGIKFVMQAEVVIIQNGFGYDLLAFEKVFPSLFKMNYRQRRGKDAKFSKRFPFRIMDTYIMSTLLYPDRPVPKEVFMMGGGAVGAHSIEAHGYRMGRMKPVNEDWSRLTDHMLHRCREDVHIGENMYDYLLGEWEEHMRRPNPMTKMDIADAYDVEMYMGIEMARQADRGFRFDMKTAWKDYLEIDAEMTEISQQVEDFIPDKVKTVIMKDKHLNNIYGGLKTQKAKGWLGLKKCWDDTLKYFDPAEHGVFVDADYAPRHSYNMPIWELTKKNGDYTAAVQKSFPVMRGSEADTVDPLVAGAFTPITYEKKGLGSLEWVKEHVLYPRGWRGVNFSDTEEEHYEEYGEYKTPWSGKIDEDSLKVWSATGTMPDWCEKICEWYVLRSRRSVILNKDDFEYYKANKKWRYQNTLKRAGCRGLLARAWNKELNMEGQDFFEMYGEFPSSYDEDWRIPAVAISIGTNTHRMRHKYVVNIPSRGLRPLRHLFIASKGKYVLGCDGAGLELRMLAHFLNDEVYTNIVLESDIHNHNQELAGLPSRDIAKTFIYAFLYGSGAKNLALVAGMTKSEMEMCIERFKAELPALARLIERCENVGRKVGYFLAVDGRWGRVRKKFGKPIIHTCLNVLLQMTGSLCMKWGEKFAGEQMVEEGVALDDNGHVCWVANVHDEVQLEVWKNEVDEVVYEFDSSGWKEEEKRKHYVGEKLYSAPQVIEGHPKKDETITIRRRYHRAGQILVENFAKAGEHLGIRIPLDGEYMIGDSWAETH